MTTAYLACALLASGLLTHVTLSHAAEAAPLGRLFMTPEARLALEHQRQLKFQATQTPDGAPLRLDGVVVRSSGKATVWINGQPQTANAADLPRETIGGLAAGEIRIHQHAPAK